MASEKDDKECCASDLISESRSVAAIGDDTIERAEKELESLKKTIAALDSLETRWKEVQQKFVETLSISLASAFGGEPPSKLTKEQKEAVFEGGLPTIEELCARLKTGSYQQVIVMTGAGISVSAGIPDYRSPGIGLYESLDLEHYGVSSPQTLSDIEFFKKNPEVYFKFHQKLFYNGKTYYPTPAHHFIRLLADRKILLRCYSQNIDNLEKEAAIPGKLLVQAHGSYQEGTCTNPVCRKKFPSSNYDKVKAAIIGGKVPKCDSCLEGIVKPDIVLYGEDLPQRFKDLLEVDFSKCDLLVVMGTSLQVQPFCSLIHRVKQTTPRLLLNRDRVGTFTLASEGGYRDIALLGDCDESVTHICKLCNWTEDFEKLLQTKETGSASRSATTSNSTTQTKEKTAFLSSTPSRSTPKLGATASSSSSSRGSCKQSSTSKRANHHKQVPSPYRK